ncbi:NAD(P)-binding domain-containing protein [Streptomyces sp. MP131-18]|uniref:NAD(P)-dependent oxidoreductase n=1 Tax=Streptomyces sp. MP131-18 TaxID=1857892 RepID=UPI00097C0624|nr:NAD(P)-binding domain-containing protein [Streptomyces sp. MP131-18]ONK11652.1 2-hydroxy-3-oxopropionate reductase [Streptomyces sp. MP131-18]
MTDIASHPQPVTVLGTGQMGAALAEALLKAGHPVTVWNRTSAKAEALTALGAVHAGDVAEAAAASRLLILCVRDAPAARTVLDAIDPASGRVVVNLTTSSPEEARDAAARAAARGLDYLDGAIQAGAHIIGRPEALLMYAGREPLFRAHEETLRVFGPDTRFLGADHALPALFDLALLGLVYELWIGYLHTLAMIGAEGLPVGSFASAAGKIVDDLVQHFGALATEVETGRYDPETFGRLVDHEVISGRLVEARASRGVDAERLRHVKRLIDRRIGQGLGEQGFSSIFESFRPAAMP